MRGPRLVAFENPLGGTGTLGSPTREPRAASRGNAGLCSKKRGFPQLPVRASKHGLFLPASGEATPSKRVARRSFGSCSFDSSATCVPNRIAIHGPCPRMRADDSPLGQPPTRRGLSGVLMVAALKLQPEAFPSRDAWTPRSPPLLQRLKGKAVEPVAAVIAADEQRLGLGRLPIVCE